MKNISLISWRLKCLRGRLPKPFAGGNARSLPSNFFKFHREMVASNQNIGESTRTDSAYQKAIEMAENGKIGDNGQGETMNIKVKTPKRVLYFSDGPLEEYSDDETETDSTPPNEHSAIVDPKTLTWGPWLSYKAWSAGSSALAVCDYLGEGLASFLGITTPKYWYEIEEYKRMEAERLKKQKEAEGWSQPTEASSSSSVNLEEIKSNQPSPSIV